MEERSLQDRFLPEGRCFGCGARNAHGLQLKSFEKDERTVEAMWTPREEHEAFPGVLNGGIIGTLLDCHSLWTGWWSLFQRDGNREPWLLTAEYTIKLLRPTPLDRPIKLVARTTELGERTASVAGLLEVDGLECASSTGTFIRPKKAFALH